MTGLLAVAAAAMLAAAPERPNVLFICADDHATAAISCYGSTLVETPGIDRLAREGMVFDRMFCTNGICAPSRAVFLTGRHSHLNGVEDNGDVFDGTQETWTTLLHDAGWQTAVIGKWHLKSDPVGFDHWEVLPGQGQYNAPEFLSAKGKRTLAAHCTDAITDLALEWLRETRDPAKPFALLVQHKGPHRNWIPATRHLGLWRGRVFPEPPTLFDDHAGRAAAAARQEMSIARHMFMFYDLKLPPADPAAKLEGPDAWAQSIFDRMNDDERAAWDAARAPFIDAFRANPPAGDDLVRWKYQRYMQDYLRTAAGVDESVGTILAALDEMGLAENTIVVYTSDQGFFLGEHGYYDKRFMYEPALRMPFVVRWPGRVAPGTRDAHLAQNLDFAPTMLDAAGLPPSAQMQGHSLLPVLRGAAPDEWRSAIYYRYSEKGVHNVEPHEGVRTVRWKLIHFLETHERELYDLEADPDEMRNLAKDPAHAAVLARLEQELDRVRAEAGVGESR